MLTNMRLVISILLFLVTVFQNVICGQTTIRFNLPLTVANDHYILDRVFFYDDTHQQSLKSKYGADLLISSFAVTDHQQYTSFFLPGECHVSIETFYDWQQGLGQYTPEILSHYLLKYNEHNYSVTRYSLTYNNVTYYLANAQKEVDGKWYFLSLEENAEFQSIIRFFSVVKPSFLLELKENVKNVKANQTLFDQYGRLQMTYLISQYSNKYRNESPLHDELNFVFDNPAERIDRNQVQSYESFKTFVQSSSIRELEKRFIHNLLDAGMIAEAVNHFIMQSGLTMEQLFLDCPKVLTP